MKPVNLIVNYYFYYRYSMADRLKTEPTKSGNRRLKVCNTKIFINMLDYNIIQWIMWIKR